MERKIGEVFKFGGEWYQCLKSASCDECAFLNSNCIDNPSLKCSVDDRTDNCAAIFKKLEKWGGPYPNADKLYQLYRLPMNIEKLPPHTEGINLVRFDIVEIEIKQNKEDMEENADIRPYDELFSPGTVSNTKHLAKEDMEEKEPTYKELLHYYHSTVGLWAINRSPQEVNLDWICKNAFQLGMDETLPNCEKIGKNLKPFNFEAAHSGKPVCTRDGRKARIICFDRVGDFPIVALTDDREYKEEGVNLYDINGKGSNECFDLMMLPEKKEGWVNIDKGGSGKITISSPYSTKEEAIHNDNETTIDTIKISWEE